MSTTDLVILAIILCLAIPLGYFLHKALTKAETDNLQKNLEDSIILTKEQREEIRLLQEKNQRLTEKEERTQESFYKLTIAYKDLQESISLQEQEILQKEYDIPPQVPHLEESVQLLSEEIDRMRAKMKKWRGKDYIKQNKKLRKKLRKARKRYDVLVEKNKKLNTYKPLLAKIKELNSAAEEILGTNEKQIAIAEKQENPAKITIKENPFSKQPAFRKKMIFKEILGADDSSSVTKPTNQAFDLTTEKTSMKKPVVARGLRDLVGINKEIEAILQNANINSFQELIDTRIARLKDILSDAGLDVESHDYNTWPIQARLAQRGEWKLIEDYKKKL